MTEIPIIILAAGSSSRLGQAKQLLEYEGATLLNHIIKQASEISNDIIVVLGARFQEISQTISNKNVQLIFNENWQTGMASSVVAGLKNRLSAKIVIISLCDQPYLKSPIFEKLITQSEISEKSIIVSNYGNGIGVPILFKQLIYNDLLQIKGDKGARSILPKFLNDIEKIDFPKGEIDIDSIQDWERFLKNMNQKKDPTD